MFLIVIISNLKTIEVFLFQEIPLHKELYENFSYFKMRIHLKIGMA